MRKILVFLKWTFASLAILVLLAYALLYFNKARLVAAINKELQLSINGEINIGNIGLNLWHEFPRASLSVENVYIRGPRYAQYHQDFLSIEKLYLNINIKKLLNKEINFSKVSIENAKVFIFKTKDGYTNLDVFKKDDKSSSDSSKHNHLLFELQDLHISNTQFVFNDTATGKSIGFTLNETRSSISAKDSIIQLTLAGDIHFLQLLFNKEKGPFLKNKNTQVNFDLTFHPTEKTLYINPSELVLETGKIELNGLLKFGKPLWYQLHFATDSIQIKEALAVLNDSIQYKLNRFGASGQIATRVSVAGFGIPSVKPKVDVWFETKNATASPLNKRLVKNIKVVGTFTNHVNNKLLNGKENAKVKIEKLHGIIDGMPFEAKAEITNLTDPLLNLNIIANANLSSINKQFQLQSLRLLRGHAALQLSYFGKLREYENNTLKTLNGKLSSKLILKNAAIHLLKKDIILQKINGQIAINNIGLQTNQLCFYIGKERYAIDLKIDGLVPFFTQVNYKTSIALSVKTNSFDMANFRKGVITKTVQETKGSAGERAFEILQKIDQMAAINVKVAAKEFVAGNFIATNAKADLSLAKNNLYIRNFEMQFANGNCKIEGVLKDLSKDWSPMQLNANFNGVDINAFLKAFNNFGMKNFGDENIDGDLYAEIKINALMDTKMGFLNDWFQAVSKLQIKDGSLVNFGPFNSIGKLYFTNRDFKNISFAEINAELSTAGVETEIKRMEISSSVLRLFVEGHYSLYDKTNIFLQVPLSNLMRKSRLLKPENIGTDTRLGPCVNFNIKTDKEGKLKLSLAPWKLLRF